MTLDARGLIGRNTGMIVKLGVRERPKFYLVQEMYIKEKEKGTKRKDPGDASRSG